MTNDELVEKYMKKHPCLEINATQLIVYADGSVLTLQVRNQYKEVMEYDPDDGLHWTIRVPTSKWVAGYDSRKLGWVEFCKGARYSKAAVERAVKKEQKRIDAVLAQMSDATKQQAKLEGMR